MAPLEVGPFYLHIIIALGVLATVTVGLRLLARWMNKGKLGVDDCWMLVAWVFMFGMVVNSGYIYVAGGNGRDFGLITPSQLLTFFKSFFASQILYYFTMTAVKISILCLYNLIFTTPSFRLASKTVGLVCIGWFVAGLFATIFQCTPVAGSWDLSLHPHCIHQVAFYLSIEGLNLLINIIILCLPLKMVWNLHLEIRQKFILLGIFSLGSLACIICLLRIISFATSTDPDISELYLRCALWTVIEPELVVISANLLTLRPLLPKMPHIFERSISWFSSSPSSSTANASNRKSWHGGISNPTQSTITATGEYPLKGYQEIQDVKDKESGGQTSRLGRPSKEAQREPQDTGIYVRNEISVV